MSGRVIAYWRKPPKALAELRLNHEGQALRVMAYRGFDVLVAPPCPVLACDRRLPHWHPTCAICGALGWSNMDCRQCRALGGEPSVLHLLADLADRRS